jgi:hypothetical protein
MKENMKNRRKFDEIAVHARKRTASPEIPALNQQKDR